MTRRLSAALSALLPTVEQTLLLRACVHRQGAPAAWTALDQRVGPDGLVTLLGANRRLVPLLHHADPGMSPDLRRRVAAVVLRERLRSSAFGRGAREVVKLLSASGRDVLVLRGPALAELAYPAPFLRHCHDLDLLVRGPDGDDIDTLSERASLHRSAFSHPRVTADDDVFWARSRTFDFGDQRPRVMAPADLLVHVCGHAFFSERRDSLSWVTDAWFTLAAWPDLDWEVVTAMAEERHLGMALAFLLTYLRRELGAPVPAGVLTRLQALEVEPVDRDIGLALAWRAARRRAPSRTRAVLSAGAGAPALVRWRLAGPT